ncbi:uncharacterized protein LOC107359408 [Tetranychus urticae]|nr:uncharacterized protein LOC107359408 [Tetranychus urticae]
MLKAILRNRVSTLISSIYAETRPTPPEKLVKSIINQLSKSCLPTNNKWNRAVDVGCGSGQATFLLADYFDQVFGFDISETQIDEAKRRNKFNNVTFKVNSGEEIPLEDGSVQLVTVCQALHFFNIEAFLAKVDALLVPGGLFVTLGYYQIPKKLIRVDDPNANLDAIGDLIEATKRIWRDHGFDYIVYTDQLMAKYRNIKLPYDRLCYEDTFDVTLRRPGTYIIDLINSLGPAIKFRDAYPDKHVSLMNKVRQELAVILNTEDLSKVMLEATFEYFIMCFKK